MNIRCRSPFAAASGLISVALLLIAPAIHAGSATWKSNPTSGDWNTAANWTPAAVPNGANDTASFSQSNNTTLSLPADVEVNTITFDSGASGFSVTAAPQRTLTISGTGIVNNSESTQNFIVGANSSNAGTINFKGSARAGTNTVFTNTGGSRNRDGLIEFSGNSSADHATFINNGSSGPNANDITEFTDTASADSANFIVNGSINQGTFGEVMFRGPFGSSGPTAANATITVNPAGGTSGFAAEVTFINATAGNALITAKGSNIAGADSGKILFFEKSSAGNSTLLAENGSNGGVGGLIKFLEASDGGTARVELFGNGTLDITLVAARRRQATLNIGSLEGDGMVVLGRTHFGIGGNKINTTFSGVIDDGGAGGSLTVKMQRRTLFLTGANTYSGGTTIKSGTLSVSNQSGSGTGTGPVQVNGGSLRGNGTIFGSVTVGDGNAVADFTPQSPQTSTGTLTINSTLTFNPSSEYQWVINSAKGIASRVVAAGVTINSNASFFAFDTTFANLPQGTVLTAIKNTSANPIAGTFSNLADGSTITVHSNTFKVNYEGGDGNDLTLTVQ